MFQVTHREYATEDVWKNWNWRSEGDLLLNGATFMQSGQPVHNLPYSRFDFIKAKSAKTVGRLTRFSGSLDCKPYRPC